MRPRDFANNVLGRIVYVSCTYRASISLKKAEIVSTAKKRLSPIDPEVLTADGAARLLGVSARLVLRLAREGKIPGKKVGKEWRFRRATLLGWLGKVELVPDWVRDVVQSGQGELVEKKRKRHSR